MAVTIMGFVVSSVHGLVLALFAVAAPGASNFQDETLRRLAQRQVEVPGLSDYRRRAFHKSTEHPRLYRTASNTDAVTQLFCLVTMSIS